MTARLSTPAKRYLFHAFLTMLFLLIILVDQIIKTAAFTISNRFNFTVLSDFFEIKTFRNYNLSFLNFIYFPTVIYILATLIIIFVFYKYIYIQLKNKNDTNLFSLDLGTILVVSGTLSNLSDRVRFGYVVDYFFLKWPAGTVFNIADAAILLGSILLIKEIIKTKF